MKLKRITAMLLAGTMMLGLAACGGSGSGSQGGGSNAGSGSQGGGNAGGETITLTGADSSAQGAAAQLLGELFAQKLEEVSGGAMKMDYFANGDLGDDATLQQNMLDGDLDIVICQTAPTVSFVPETAVFDLPMVFAPYDGETIETVLNGDGEFNTQISAAYEKAGIELLAFLQNATYRNTTSNKALNTVADFNGLSIRTMENANHMAFWKALGAQPTALPFSELFVGLQNGTVTAQENANDTNVGNAFYDVQKYLCETKHILYLNQVMMNKSKYDSLTDEQKGWLDEALTASLTEIRDQMATLDSENEQTMANEGMTIITYDQAFYDEVLALQGVQDLYKSIDQQVGGLGSTLQSELEAAAGTSAAA